MIVKVTFLTYIGGIYTSISSTFIIDLDDWSDWMAPASYEDSFSRWWPKCLTRGLPAADVASMAGSPPSPPLWQLISCLIGKRPCKRGWFLKAVPDDLGIEINLGEMEDATLLILTS